MDGRVSIMFSFRRFSGVWMPKVILGDAREVVRHLPDGFVDCVITSPPYWMQRDHRHPRQIGREETPEEYVREIVALFENLRPKLRRTATVFLNVGYKYVNEELILIPEMIALEMKRKGFVLKNKIIWWKPNAMPTPARNRFNDVYEPIFFFIRDDGREMYYFNLEEVSERPKTLEHYARLLSIPPQRLLGVRVIDALSTRKSREGKVIGVRFTSIGSHQVLVKWRDGEEEWVPFGNPLKNYPKEVSFICPVCGGPISNWDIRLSFANWRRLLCPTCRKVLCTDSKTFPLPNVGRTSLTREGEVSEVVNPDVEVKRYVTRVPRSSKFLRAGMKEVSTASPAGRIAIAGEHLTIKRRWDIPQLLIAKYLRYWRKRRGIRIEEIDRRLGYSYTAGHWFRLDFGWWGRGGSVPRPRDWLLLKEILKFDNIYDRVVTEKVAVLQTVKPHEKGRNPGDVWKILLEQYPGTHFSTFPSRLVEMAMKVGCPPGGVVLDPFAGSGTVGEVAMKLGRKAVLIELIPEFVELIRERCKGQIEVVNLENVP